jgi:4-hydroxybenzoate polyprenyltransferase/phosphoserine phosphatase
MKETVLSLYPLIVDLDGTLIHTDMLHESALRVLQDKPFDFLRIPYWLVQGRAAVKQQLARRASFDPASLPYNRELLDWIRLQRAQGRKVILCTAADHAIAASISAYLGIFDEVMASDGVTNLSGVNKAEALEQRFGSGGFDYVGNSRSDLAVWQRARHAIVANASIGLQKQVEQCCKVEKVFVAPSAEFATWRKMLRLHQWMKNILLFVPFFAAHQIANPNTWESLFLAFVSFSLCASSVYIANDMLDLESDRQHPHKKKRPFASGSVQVWIGVVLAPILLCASIVLARFVGGNFLAWLLLYFALTCAYSLGLKRLILVDCLTLAMLYTLRIVAGAAAANMPLSFWLLAFSVFLFLSLAYIKRYAELQLYSNRDPNHASSQDSDQNTRHDLQREKQQIHGQQIHGRGYRIADAPLVQIMGIASGYAAVIVLAFYLNSDKVVRLYRTPEMVWGEVPVTLFWISWMWVQAHRGQMNDDPLIFALKDKASLLAGAAFVAVLIAGTLSWPW